MTEASSGGGKLVPLAPDGGWGWVVVFGSFLIHVFSDGFVYSFGVLVDSLKKEFGASDTFSALIISLLTGLTLGSGPFASAVCNKYGCRITTILGASISFIGCLCALFATEMWHIAVAVGIIMGFGFGLMYCPAIVIVTMYFEKRRSLATGIAVAGAGVGTAIFSPFNAFLTDAFGWRSVFLVLLVILTLCAIAGITFKPLQFVLVPEEDPKIADGSELTKMIFEETAALLSSPMSNMKRALSHDSGVCQADTGEGTSEITPQPRSRSGTIGEINCGYVNRKDVFYTGSIQNVAEFRDHPDKYRSTGSLHAKPEENEQLFVENDDKDAENENNNIIKTISNMLSLPLLLDPIFLLFAISNLLISVGFNSPLYFLPLHATSTGLSEPDSALILTVFGICNTVGRVIFGLIGDHKLPLPYGIGEDTARNRLWMYNISLTICGLLTTFCYTFVGFIPLCIYAGLFGFSIASYICLTSVLLVDLLGLDKLTNAFGLLLLWQGVGTVFGPILSGHLADKTGNYTLSFVFCGVNMMISGLMLFAIPIIQKNRGQ